MVNKDRLVTLRLTESELEAIDQQAAIEGRDRSSMIRWAVQQYLNQERDDR